MAGGKIIDRHASVLSLLAAVCVFLLFLPSEAHATQQHGDPEGLYSHQIAHIFFISTMLVLIVQIRWRSPLHAGWRYIGIAAFLFLLWNIDTFTVHVLRETLTPGMFTGSTSDWTQRLDISSTGALLVYIGKIMDHVLLVGAVGTFALGIRSFSSEEFLEED